MATYEETIAARIEKVRDPARYFLRALHAHTETAYQLMRAWERAERAGLSADRLDAGYPDELISFDELHSALIDWRDTVLKGAEEADAADPEVKVEMECSCHRMRHGPTVWIERMRRSEMKENEGAMCPRDRVLFRDHGRVIRVTEIAVVEPTTEEQP